jgi:leucyl aminopeptidase
MHRTRFRPSARAARRGLLAASLAAALLAAPASDASEATAPGVWITLGDPAFQLLRGLAPAVRSDAQRAWTVQAPARGTHGPALHDETETVHVVQVDEAMLPALSGAIHGALHHCAGFVRHASRADALHALDTFAAGLRARPAVVVPSYAIDNQDLVVPMLAQMQDSRILSTIQDLSDFTNRYYKTDVGVSASDHVASLWKTLAGKRKDVTVQQFAHAGWPQKSVVLTIRGTTKPAEILVLGGHLDTINIHVLRVKETTSAPGADDDASGIASITEVLRVMMANQYHPRRTIQFIAYAAEEEGLLGSAQIADQWAAQGRKVVGVMQLDMTNWHGSAEDVFLYTDYTNAAQNGFVADLAASYLPEITIGYDRCGYACSDHASWNAHGYATSMPFEAALGDDFPYIHSPNDTLANMGNQATNSLPFARLALAFGVELGTDGPTAK